MHAGARVLYRLDAHDATTINQRRNDFTRYQATADNHKHPHGPTPGGSGASGHIAHIGLEVTEGQQFPADVTIVNASGTLCLRVLLPGSDTQWVVNVGEGDHPGQWTHAPVRV
jgi:hypothetical protein